MDASYIEESTVVVEVLAIEIHLTNTASRFYIASISDRNEELKPKYESMDLVDTKMACLGIHMTTHPGAGPGVVMPSFDNDSIEL